MNWVKLTEKKPQRDQVVLIRLSSGVTEARYVLEEQGDESYNLGWYFRLHPPAPDNDRIDECFVMFWAELPKEETKKDKKKISKSRYEDLLLLLDGYEEIAKSIMKTYQITTLADIPEANYQSVIKRIQALKRTHDEYARRS